MGSPARLAPFAVATLLSCALMGANPMRCAADVPAPEIGGITWDSQADFQSQSTLFSVDTSSSPGLLSFRPLVVTELSAGAFHFAALRSDGTVVAVASPEQVGECDVGGWRDIVSIATGTYSTLGVRADGTVVGTYMAPPVSGWRDVVKIDAAGGSMVAGLTSDGRVLVWDPYAEYGSVSNWSNVADLTVGSFRVVGIRADGTLLVAGQALWSPFPAESNEARWQGVTKVISGPYDTFGIRPDGQVAVSHGGDRDMSVVESWTDIVDAAVGWDALANNAIGVRSDGSVVCTGTGYYPIDVSSWVNIKSVAVGDGFAAGLKRDGSVVTAGYRSFPNIEMLTAGRVGGDGSRVGLRGSADGLHHWTEVRSDITTLAPGQAVKLAARVSTNGVSWSAPLGSNGLAVDWRSGVGNYFGMAAGDSSWRGDLQYLPRKRFIDFVVQMQASGAETVSVDFVSADYEVQAAPVATEDSTSCAEDSSATLSLHSNDYDANGDALRNYSLVRSPAHGYVVLSGAGEAVYHPEPDFNGTDTFTYKMSDGTSDSEIAVATITVTPVSDKTSFESIAMVPTKGDTYSYSGRLVSRTTSVSGQPVELLECSNSSGRYHPVSGRAVSTDEQGRFCFRGLRPKSNTWYRAVFAGAPDVWDAETSTATYAIPRAYVSNPVAPFVMQAAKSYSVTGSMRPTHLAGSYPIRIYVERYRSGAWLPYGYVKAKASNITGGSKYTASVKLPYRGRWRLRAYHPTDTGHYNSWSSGYDYVTVR